MDIYKLALDSISAHIAIIDTTGQIIETNRAWREYGEKNGIRVEASCIGLNYLETCDRASTSPTDDTARIAAGIRQVLGGEIEEFFINYPCHSPTEEHWFALRVVKFRDPGSGRAVMSHEDITPLMHIHRDLAKKEENLREQAGKLEESNIALKVLLDHRQKDRVQLEENMLANIRTLILPYVHQLMNSPLPKRERTILEILEERLNEIASPFLNRLGSLNTILTPQEIKVATMVREGRSSADIAEIMAITTAAVDFHRKHIRRKLGLSKSGSNLRSYLLGLQ
ncbi:MAG: helix-turn-helix transcriptional regulator [Desulforhopalus sp.]|nr:helix-turn-helix transcriptional regulator [Desulforhopalus sp.]